MSSETIQQQRGVEPGTTLHRSFAVDRAKVDTTARTVELAFSSETPYERYWGVEILDHSSKSIRMGRLKQGGPLLMDHDTRDQVGVIESVQIGPDRVGRAVVRFGKSERAEEVFQDVIDGIRRNVSVGYMVHEAQLVSEKDGVGTYRVVDWEPLEVSIVAIPADASVGVGRSASQPKEAAIAASPVTQRLETIMTTEATIDPKVEQARGASDERKRIAEIIAIGSQFKHYGGEALAQKAIAEGKTEAQLRQDILEVIASKPLPTSDIGMTKKETQSYSFVRLLNALANPTNQRAQEAAGFEIEAGRAAADKLGRAARGVMVPSDVLKRDLLVGTSTAGGHTVQTDLLASDFITLLRNSMVIMGMGTRMLTGLQGNIAIPRHTGAATAYWVAENAAPTESQQAFDQVAMQPRTVGAFTDISRKLLLQSSIDVEAFVRQDLATVLGQEIQRVAINGSGTAPEPRGIINQSGIGSVAGGTNGLAPTWDNIVNLETAVATANADVGALQYLTNAKVRGRLKRTFIDSPGSGQRVWSQGDTPVNGYAAAVTNAVPSNLTKGTSSGVCSAILFGNFADLIIGMWGGLDLMSDPYTGSTAGTVRVVALQDVDVAIRHPESFAAMLDALTV